MINISPSRTSNCLFVLINFSSCCFSQGCVGNDRCIPYILLASSSFYVSYYFNFRNNSLLIDFGCLTFIRLSICKNLIIMVFGMTNELTLDVTHHYMMFSFSMDEDTFFCYLILLINWRFSQLNFCNYCSLIYLD